MPSLFLMMRITHRDTTQTDVLKKVKMAFSFHTCEGDQINDTNVIN